jgi:hypothetical protein
MSPVIDTGFTVHCVGQYWDDRFSTHNLKPRKIREWTTPDWILNYTFNFPAPAAQKEVVGYAKDVGKNATMKGGKDNNVIPVSTAEYSSRGWRAWLNGATITLGVNNVFDLAPPFVAASNEKRLQRANSQYQRANLVFGIEEALLKDFLPDFILWSPRP